MPSDALVIINNNEEIRRESSSGGFFSAIASHVLAEKGIVVGAAFDQRFHVQHVIIDSIDDLNSLRGSKYIQSRMGEVFKKIKEYLDNNRLCLFVGTPCQCEGLLNYLGLHYDNLITVDFICHGVPSTIVMDSYLKYIEANNKNETIKSFSFRDKSNGWSRFNIRIVFEGNQEPYVKWFNDDVFGQTFNQNLFLRDACYECRFKKYERRTDYTMADFWGILKYIPDHDDRGYSLVIPQSRNSYNELSKLDISILLKLDLMEATQNNRSIITSPNMQKSRPYIYKELTTKGLNYIYHKYCSMSLYDRIRRKIRKIGTKENETHTSII